MPLCAHCQATSSKKDGHNTAGQQRFRVAVASSASQNKLSGRTRRRETLWI
jgi:hypothetical protein